MCLSTAELCLAMFKAQGHGSCNALSLFSGTGAHTSKSLGSSDGAIFFFFLSYLQNLSLTWMNWEVQILNLYPYTEVEGLNKAKLLIKDKHRYRGRVLLWAGILFYQLKKNLFTEQERCSPHSFICMLLSSPILLPTELPPYLGLCSVWSHGPPKS